MDTRHPTTEFLESSYLEQYADVRDAVKSRSMKSGAQHFLSYGAAEGRAPNHCATPARSYVDWLLYTRSGFTLVGGWIDDEGIRIKELSLDCGFVRVRIDPSQIVRQRRRDVEQALHGAHRNYEYGWCALVEASMPLSAVQEADISIASTAGKGTHKVTPKIVTEEELLKYILGVIGTRETCGSKNARTLHDTQATLGTAVGALWKSVLAYASPYSETLVGDPVSHPDVSICTVLYKRPDPISLQASLLHPASGVNSEIIYAVNSPELEETVMRDAEIARRVYGQTTRVLTFKGNTGFGYANNICVEAATSDRIALINPDVTAMAPAWGREALRAMDAAPRSILGGLLFYSDGSVMHDGMQVVADALPRHGGESANKAILRVHHFSKGAPSWSIDERTLRSRPAVSGAAMLTSKRTYEELGGFAERYVFGHYEDADLCLRAWQAGVPVGVARTVRLYHLEGKGAVWEPHHGGASLLNRCVFTHRWAERHQALSTAAESYEF